eukprot:2534-Heterococcus_DN1.PRE.2
MQPCTSQGTHLCTLVMCCVHGHCRQPRGFAFIEFYDSGDARAAQALCLGVAVVAAIALLYPHWHAFCSALLCTLSQQQRTEANGWLCTGWPLISLYTIANVRTATVSTPYCLPDQLPANMYSWRDTTDSSAVGLATHRVRSTALNVDALAAAAAAISTAAEAVEAGVTMVITEMLEEETEVEIGPTHQHHVEAAEVAAGAGALHLGAAGAHAVQGQLLLHTTTFISTVITILAIVLAQVQGVMFEAVPLHWHNCTSAASASISAAVSLPIQAATHATAATPRYHYCSVGASTAVLSASGSAIATIAHSSHMIAVNRSEL